MKFKVRFPACDFVLMVFVAFVLPGSLWAQGNFVYTNDNFGNNVSAFSVAPNGALTPVPGSPFPTGGIGDSGAQFGTNSITTVGNLLFASNTFSGDVSAFLINPLTGGLTLVPGSLFALEPSFTFLAEGISVSATPDGRFLMASNSNGSFLGFTITVFSIGSNGVLTRIPGSPFPTLVRPNGIKVSPDGRFLAVAAGMEMFSIGTDGSLTSLGGLPVRVAGIDIDCSSSLLYGGLPGDSQVVDGFSIASNGKLTPVPGSPFTPSVGRSSNVVLLSPNDKTLFVSNQFSNTITAFSVATNGSLTLVAGSPFPMNPPAEFPVGMATSQDGKLLYVADFSNAVSVFSVGSNGALTEVQGSPVVAHRTPPALLWLTAFPQKSCVLTAGIEIKPPTLPPVCINPRSYGRISVAILSTLPFNAVTDVVTGSLTFGSTGHEASLAFCDAHGEDVNDDGLADLVCHFNSRQAGFKKGDTMAVLNGKTTSGRQIRGQEVIRTCSERDDCEDDDRGRRKRNDCDDDDRGRHTRDDCEDDDRGRHARNSDCDSKEAFPGHDSEDREHGHHKRERSRD